MIAPVPASADLDLLEESAGFLYGNTDFAFVGSDKALRDHQAALARVRAELEAMEKVEREAQKAVEAWRRLSGRIYVHPPMAPLSEALAALEATRKKEVALTCDECGDPATHYGDGHYCEPCGRTLTEAAEEMDHEAHAQAREP